jgi:hypothetical protein
MTMPAGKSAKASAETAPPAEIQALLNLLLADPKVQVRLAVRVEPGKPIPTILITALHDERMQERALQAGVICYLANANTETVARINFLMFTSVFTGWQIQVNLDMGIDSNSN